MVISDLLVLALLALGLILRTKRSSVTNMLYQGAAAIR